MKMFSKRSALIGWVTWMVGKRIAKRKMRKAASRRSQLAR